MRRFDCQRARQYLDSGAELELSEQQRTALEAHLAICEECLAHAQLWDQLGGALRDEPLEPLPPMVERRMLTGVVREPSRRRPHVAWSRVAVAGLATACLALVAVIVSERATREEVSLRIAEPITSEPGQGELKTPSVIRGASPGTALWLDPSSHVHTRSNDHDQARFVLDTGHVVAEIGPNEPGYRFVVETPSSLVEAHGTIFSVEVTPLGEERVRVTEGVVEVRSKAGGQLRSLVAGTELTTLDEEPVVAAADGLQRDLRLMATLPAWPDEPLAPEVADEPLAMLTTTAPPLDIQPAEQQAPVTTQPQGGEDPAVDLDVETLTRQAQAQQRAGEFERACESYLALIERWPQDATARNSQVSLGQLQLDRLGRAEDALQQFDAYLAADPGGVLAEDARIGRVRAMDRMDRWSDAQRAADAFLQYHPYSGVAAEVLRLRGDARRAQGDLLGAADDYQEVLERWPGSPQATLARQGLTACQEGG